MPAIHSLAVFCGSRVGAGPAYAEAGRALGRGLARAGIRLVYGGGRIGIMGVVADAVLQAGGNVLGVIPDFLTRIEVAHQAVSEMIVTDSMHARKLRLYEEADAFLTMPGGLGTFDETFEVITWRQLGLHDKPILLCNVAGWAATDRRHHRSCDRPGFRRVRLSQAVRGARRRSSRAGTAANPAGRYRRTSRTVLTAKRLIHSAQASCAAKATADAGGRHAQP